jgi:hypothetical protein
MDTAKGQWYWNSGPDPFATGESAQWTPYSQQDNDLIEQSFKSQAEKVELKNYIIHFALNTQIHKIDFNKQRQVKRETI